MIDRRVIVPLFLVFCLLLGGSAQAIVGNLALRLSAIALLAWACLSPAVAESSPRGQRSLSVIIWLTFALLLLQLIPLPPTLWTALPGRTFVADGLALLRQPLPWMSWSLAPYDTFAAILTLLVPSAVLVAMLRARAFSPALLVGALLAGTLAGSLLGIVQVGGGERWYLYQHSAFNAAAGFFANSNHMATLLLVSIPFLAALAMERSNLTADRGQRASVFAVALAVGAVLLIAILFNGSFAILLLGIPVALATLIMIAKSGGRRRFLLARATMLGLGALAAIALVGAAMTGLRGNRESYDTRVEIWSTTIKALDQVGLAGSGVGSFPGYYRRFEDPARVTSTYVNHAHNDYLEIAVEAGPPGVMLLVAFLTWWLSTSVRIWRDPESGLHARAATIATATILLHSLVDYPLRTAAIDAVMAMCLALMLLRQARPLASEPNQLRPTRHHVIG